mmetsp:Transcript_19230/g.67906  ORF Transcript_19230/g.67906 Transcript_19230/m.67906 type:complete len:302 (-) Transcript_19230:1267-2172(-)
MPQSTAHASTVSAHPQVGHATGTAAGQPHDAKLSAQWPSSHCTVPGWHSSWHIDESCTHRCSLPGHGTVPAGQGHSAKLGAQSPLGHSTPPTATHGSGTPVAAAAARSAQAASEGTHLPSQYTLGAGHGASPMPGAGQSVGSPTIVPSQHGTPAALAAAVASWAYCTKSASSCAISASSKWWLVPSKSVTVGDGDESTAEMNAHASASWPGWKLPATSSTSISGSASASSGSGTHRPSASTQLPSQQRTGFAGSQHGPQQSARRSTHLPSSHVYCSGRHCATHLLPTASLPLASQKPLGQS